MHNLHGVTDIDPATNKPYHYDYCVAVNSDGVEYEQPAGQFKFTANERSEETKGSYGPGRTGIAAGQTLSYFTNNIMTPPDDLEHYLFAGWYTDPNFDPSAKIANIDEWKMPDHEQDIYANWTPPTRQVRFNTYDDIEHSQTETKGTAKDCVYDTLIEKSKIPEVTEPQGYHFTSWYYYLTKADKEADKKTWFDPYTMELPWVTYDEYTDTNDDNAVLTLHQEWTENKEVDYEFHFRLGSATGEEIAPYVQGTGKAGESITYDTTTKPVSDYYSGYGGFVVANPSSYTMTLDFDSTKNVYNFIYQ